MTNLEYQFWAQQEADRQTRRAMEQRIADERMRSTIAAYTALNIAVTSQAVVSMMAHALRTP